ncbi:hypothetical protein PP175_28190 (plasmid) [Aneurinibacillus sp. Ricciae_BoGa-3]|uniref:hypothetical protein n=1 Tax=Aneurinibacillus sp. Ricciae_BoGa-3 TaxID=3022697 RepID=UPI002341238A|nr:hypothetical protein [Aneurinibacillus sp. Ricciae_BoGa-3]WCK57071.1 hypothetical protein PP175_28190 [Aneurinibacillus sp. Ricciae_BoGa-3]
MKFGQMSLPRVSANADYIQLDICGLNKEQTLSRFLSYETNLPVILHGDWTKKGASENNIAQRKQEYVTIIQTLLKHTSVLGFTMHPLSERKCL